MKKIILSVMLVALSLGLLVGCGSNGTSDENGKMKVALLLPGSINDGSWNTAAYNGLKEMEAKGDFEIAFTEKVAVNDIEEAFMNYARSGYDLVIGHGFEFGEPALRVAKDFPDVNFYVSGKAPDNAKIGKNVGFIDQKEFEGAYLAGVLAGLMTESNKVGYVGGMKIPIQIANYNAFEAGAKSVNPDVKILGVLTGTFEDPGKGKEAALAQIDNGADIIAQAADSTGVGAIEAAKANNIKLIGYGTDQSDLAPTLFLTCFFSDIPKAIGMQGDKIKEGSFGGEVWKAGIKEGIVDITKFGNSVPADIAAKVNAIKQDIIDGKIKVPEIYQ